MKTSKEEIIDILKAWVVISVVFAIIQGTGSIFSNEFLDNFLISALTVGVGFLLHELAHKILAQKYGAIAEFRAFNPMLLFALVLAFLRSPIIFAAPGAVMIHGGNINIKKYGKISLVGPLTNLVLAVIFLIIQELYSGPIISKISDYGFIINTWLALFNMIPVWEFDGRKIFAWSKLVWFAVVIIGLFFFIYLRPIFFNNI